MTETRTQSCRRGLVAGGIIAAAVAAAYHGILSAPFVYLDLAAIRENPTIRQLWPIWKALWPSRLRGITVEGRPVLNLSLAINYAISGTNVWSYHAVNVLIHVLAALTLAGIVRRTAAGLGAKNPDFLGFGTALLWALHPLQTESVTYTVQRAESLMGLFYLLTLYCFIRYADETLTRSAPGAIERDETHVRIERHETLARIECSGTRKRFVNTWAAGSIIFCLLGMATKEVMVSAPVMVLCYDRTFLSGTFRAAWARNRCLYLALFASWIPLAWFVLTTGGNRGGTSGFGLQISFWSYLLTQFPAVAHYLRLAFWPHPLVFYYAVDWVTALQAVPCAVPVVLLAAVSAIAFFRRSAWGFLGVFFFAILAPTSLVPGMSQTLAEHRMYLALAPAMVALVWVLGSIRRPLVPLILIAAAFGLLTSRRNRVYRSEAALWSDTVAKAPSNPYSQNNLGIALVGTGDRAAAIGHFRAALALNADYAAAEDNLGLALAETGDYAGAIAHYGRALQIKPAYPDALANLGVALANTGRLPEAVADLERAVALDPDYAAPHNDLAVLLAASERLPDAIVQYREALRLAPDNAETHYNLANALAGLERWPEAVGHYEEALRLRPAYVEACANLGVALAKTGRLADAAARYEQALKLAPGDPEVEYNLGLALRALGRTAEAQSHFDIARRLRSGP